MNDEVWPSAAVKQDRQLRARCGGLFGGQRLTEHYETLYVLCFSVDGNILIQRSELSQSLATTIPTQCGEARHLRSIFVETPAETTAERDNRRTRGASN